MRITADKVLFFYNIPRLINSFKKELKITSANKQLISIIWPFILTVGLLLISNYVFMDILSGVRAYVGA